MSQVSIRQAIQAAIGHHQAGRFAEAESLYRQVLAIDPRQVDCLHLLGLIALQTGHADAALDLMGRAITIDPKFPEAHNSLGNVHQAMKRNDLAIASYQRAVEIYPDYPEALNNLGNALQAEKRCEEAIPHYRRAIALRPDYAEAHNNLARALQELRRMDEAIVAYQKFTALRRNDADAHLRLANALREQNRLEDAAAAYERVIEIRPEDAEAHNWLGIMRLDMGRVDEAEACFRKAIALRPEGAEQHNNLGNVLKMKGRNDQAVKCYQDALAIDPNYGTAYNNLANVLHEIGRPDEAIVAFRRAIELEPGSTFAQNNLGNVLKDTGRFDESWAAYEQAIELSPNNLVAYSNQAYSIYFHPDADNRAIAAAQSRIGKKLAGMRQDAVHPNAADPDRRLKVGYVAPDFRNHCQSFFTIPLLSHHERSAYEIHVYSSVAVPDVVTERLRGNADCWRDVAGMSDDALAEQVRKDGIDILVDLTMNMAHNRPVTFALKPAPVQVAWLAYPGSTGQTAIDYRLSDPYLDPPGADESIYSERTVRLPHTFWCYDPLSDENVSALPALSAGHVTFGSLNSFCKVNDRAIALWAGVLRAVRPSRMIILAPPGNSRTRTMEAFACEGIELDRIEFVPFASREEYLRTYHRIDLGLDAIPYNGHTTSLDSLWMGVPVITLVGNTIVGRAGLSQMSNLGLQQEFAATTPEEYVGLAQTWAGDLAKLAEIRNMLRLHMKQSPLMNAQVFTSGVEAAYRTMWQTWCLQNV